jgi:hypothetical protein
VRSWHGFIQHHPTVHGPEFAAGVGALNKEFKGPKIKKTYRGFLIFGIQVKV